MIALKIVNNFNCLLWHAKYSNVTIFVIAKNKLVSSPGKTIQK
nr:MAG TPA: hypothetical protein [Caudoviricetes sp.]